MSPCQYCKGNIFGDISNIFGDICVWNPLPCKASRDPKKVLKSYLKKLKKKDRFSFLTDENKKLPTKNKKRQAKKGNYE